MKPQSCCYYLPAVELVGVLLPGVVEVEAEVRVDADAEVVVHHEDLRVVLRLRPCGHRRCNVSTVTDPVKHGLADTDFDERELRLVFITKIN